MKVTHVKPGLSYCLELKFDTGETGVVDLSALAGRGVFSAWLQPGVFEQVSIGPAGALEWPGEIDLCPEAMYLQATGKRADEVFPALQGRFSHA